MSDNFSQLDQLIESDILEALGESTSTSTIDSKLTNFEEELDIGTIDEEVDVLSEEHDDIGDIEILPLADIDEAIDNQEPEKISNIIPNDINTNDLASLLSQLLNNKTIEITIKIKD